MAAVHMIRYFTVVGPGFKVLLRDINEQMVEAWKETFGKEDKYASLVEVATKPYLPTPREPHLHTHSPIPLHTHI